MLNPLAQSYKAVVQDGNNLNDEFNVALFEAIKKIVELVPMGFSFAFICVPIAVEFIHVMETCTEIVGSESLNSLHLYKKMFSVEVRKKIEQLKVKTKNFLIVSE